MAKAKMDACAKKEANRKAQAKYQKKQPAGKQAAAVKKSTAKTSTKAASKSGSGSKGAGTKGGKIGRPREGC